MLDACTKYKCVNCPALPPRSQKCHPHGFIASVLDLVRTSTVRGLAQVGQCLHADGECIKACDYGVNPRFLLAMETRRRPVKQAN